MKTKPPKKISIDKDAPCHFTYKELKELYDLLINGIAPLNYFKSPKKDNNQLKQRNKTL